MAFIGFPHVFLHDRKTKKYTNLKYDEVMSLSQDLPIIGALIFLQPVII